MLYEPFRVRVERQPVAKGVHERESAVVVSQELPPAGKWEEVVVVVGRFKKMSHFLRIACSRSPVVSGHSLHPIVRHVAVRAAFQYTPLATYEGHLALGDAHGGAHGGVWSNASVRR